jgi:N-acetylmuramoyl-L-alanine amidase
MPLVSASASSRIHHNDAWGRQQFAKAERMREALNGRPAKERTRHEYQRVIDSYRRVYFGSPASSKADPSVVATAELMVEMGRRFDDDKILRGAIDQYRFLRKEYPGSRYRFDALFTIGEIYKDDLNDALDARATFTDFVNRYPHNRLAGDALAAIAEIDVATVKQEKLAKKAAKKQRSAAGSVAKAGGTGGDTTGGGNVNVSADTSDAGSLPEGAPEGSAAVNGRRANLPRVTGVRHWSTPDYTRVAIDVEQEVKFGSQRISNPDRIFFDLHDTTLASTLVGKTFDVDDGFLKKIRVAETQGGRTRIVLEVDDLASYNAFLLPDPYRLIIDIHGKQKRTMAGANLSDAASADANTDSNVDTKADSKADSKSDSKADAKNDQSEESASSKDAVKPARAKSSSRDEKTAVRSSNNGLVETDLPPQTSADLKSQEDAKSGLANKTRGGEVIKTTVAVKGSNRRIPKTIVKADDKAEDAADEADTSPTASGTSSATTSGTSVTTARRKKSHSAATSTIDANDLGPDFGTERREAQPTAAGGRSLTRALGLKIGKIVIDAGHGGHDVGTVGPNGLYEKDVVLDVAKRLGRLLESRLGAEVIYTRRDDTFIPLETRTAIANRERADLFISIHANSSRDSDARGVETYYLNFTSSPEALEVAARENAVSEKSIHELQDLVKKIALKEKIEESREFAGDVQESLYGGLSLNSAGIRNRGIKKAPFIVLIGANMPSILAEISFVSNPTDERKMETAEHRQRIAESLYRGVSKYCNGLSGVKIAAKIDKDHGQ